MSEAFSRGLRPRQAVASAVALLAGAVVCGGLAMRAERTHAPAAATASPATAVLSLRRAPVGITDAVAGARLTTGLDAIFGDKVLGGGGPNSCLIVHDDRGRVLYSRNPTTPMIPASNLKLLAATVLLDRIGPEARLRTEVVGQPPSSGTVQGNLWLVGAGDPLLATADFAAQASFNHTARIATSLESLADAVVTAGVRTVTGSIVGDDTRFDGQRAIPTWLPVYLTDHQAGPITALLVNGGFSSYRPPIQPAAQPATFAATTLTFLLGARGVHVAGPPTEGKAAADAAPVASVVSPTIHEIVGEMLKESDNTAAEMLVKELGARFAGAGTTVAGINVIRDDLTRLGLPVADVQQLDGSGLDRGDRATCDLFVRVLDRSGPTGLLARALPVAGREGTLRKRFVGTPAAGRIRAKTGSLDNVVALSGWATGARGHSLTFSLLAGSLPRASAGIGLEDRVANVLALYPRAPDPATIVP
ncbi:MAG: D-alanyl-D-alanine carboxypeptidase/D-alanyl-D-alanine-endopeptidase [Acidimicrobiales bacterium]|jgi:D-alanyl-D-alanine carboxypeptidase/D-alanyl-D-alanine-endopeptidase (penicillin-binding protein 4)|nr:D-alanyl-D-alanine carboxypeptidase/D-alanyl-D-alanine-endopeptidase [Acidimicrobiales bacterium]